MKFLKQLHFILKGRPLSYKYVTNDFVVWEIIVGTNFRRSDDQTIVAKSFDLLIKVANNSFDLLI